MKTRSIGYARAAIEDLLKIETWIAEKAGVRVADGYIDRIQLHCQSLELASERGAARDDLLPGLRNLGFEKRATIVFRVLPDHVEILRISYGGQDWEAAFRDEETD